MVAVVSAVSTFCAFAQDDDFDFDVSGDDMDDQAIESVGDESPTAESSDDEEAGDDEDGVAKPKKEKGPAHILKTLPFCHRLEGKAEILKPGAKAWVSVEEGKFYPLGSSFRTTDSSSLLQIQFGDTEDLSVEIRAYPSSFSTRFQQLGEKSRTISLQSGVVTVKLPRNLPDGTFSVVTPTFEVKNMKGSSRYAYTRNSDGDVTQIRCLTGSLAIEGRNFFFPEVKTACEVKIRSSQDQLFTGLYGNRGDSIVRLDQGERRVKDFATGEIVTEKKPLEWKLSPKTAVRIHRAMPDIGERMSVTVMTFDASGALRNRCAFAEGRSEVNTGELAPSTTVASDDSAKKAAEAAEVDAVDADADEGEEGASGDDAAADSGTDDVGGGGEDDFEF